MTTPQPLAGDVSAGYHFQAPGSAFAPEADLVTVARGNFSALSSPILVACRDQKQFEEFCFREGLICSEVRRFQLGRWNPKAYRADKVLILLPAWWDHLQTRKAVEQWVNQLDRYTVELSAPRPIRKARAWGWMIIGCLTTWITLAALVWWLF